jgi:acetate kinase
MSNVLLVINTGSSSIKFAIFAQDTCLRLYKGQVDGIAAQAQLHIIDTPEELDTENHPVVADNHAQALQVIMDWLAQHTTGLQITAVGHRVVHGGSNFTRPALVDQNVLTQLKALIPLAPLHQPHALQAIEVLLNHYPDIPQVACFDTAFHANMPAREKRLPLPQVLSQQGVQRYGFHGLSYEYITQILPGFLNNSPGDNVVIAHLGHGVSMCAVKNRQSIATTMSFTPLDGLPMGKRCGAIDPAIVLYLLAQGMNAQEISDLLHHQSGLLGLSGISDDMQILLNSIENEAAEAVDIFCYRVSRELGSLAMALGGLDVLVFTGGIGEHAASVRANICQAAGWLGVEIDTDANQANALQISSSTSRVSVWAIPTDEEHVIVRQTADLITAVP